MYLDLGDPSIGSFKGYAGISDVVEARLPGIVMVAVVSVSC